MVKPADATGRPAVRFAIPDATTSSGSRVRLIPRRNARIEQLLHEVLGALEPASTPRRAAARWLPAVREALEEQAHPIRSLASNVGVHPVHLAHAFQKEAFRVELTGDAWVITARFDSGAAEASALRMLDVDFVRSR
jgi:hypothetical protein